MEVDNMIRKQMKKKNKTNHKREVAIPQDIPIIWVNIV